MFIKTDLDFISKNLEIREHEKYLQFRRQELDDDFYKNNVSYNFDINNNFRNHLSETSITSLNEVNFDKLLVDFHLDIDKVKKVKIKNNKHEFKINYEKLDENNKPVKKTFV